jgi:branched-chain amino acid transport system substrate-binding protein
MASSLLGKAVAGAKKNLIDADTRLTADQKKNWVVRVIANNWGIGETTPSICGTACQDIFYGLFPVPRYGDLAAGVGMSALVALHDEFTGKDTKANGVIPARASGSYQDVRYVQGYVAALMWRKAVEKAIDANNRNPTPDDLKAALETFQLENMQGLTASPVSFSEDDHRPQSAANVYKIGTGGSLALVDSYKIGLVPDWLGY